MVAGQIAGRERAASRPRPSVLLPQLTTLPVAQTARKGRSADTMKFSERVSAQVVPRQIQLESMDDALRNSLWNEILPRFGAPSANWGRAVAFLGQYLFKIPVDGLPEADASAHRWLRERFFEAPWYEVY